jgi:hypothetical protein
LTFCSVFERSVLAVTLLMLLDAGRNLGLALLLSARFFVYSS